MNSDLQWCGLMRKHLTVSPLMFAASSSLTNREKMVRHNFLSSA